MSKISLYKILNKLGVDSNDKSYDLFLGFCFFIILVLSPLFSNYYIIIIILAWLIGALNGRIHQQIIDEEKHNKEIDELYKIINK